ncbi:MAG: archaeosortase/exosortase family protein [Candidatus Bathyarchaeota archaeon]
MLSNNLSKNRTYQLRILFVYLAVATIIILVVYYFPNYFFLEKAVAHNTAFLLNSLGIHVETNIISGNVFLSNVKIVKDCTGVQVVAVFLGLLLPVPTVSWKKKLVTLLFLSTILYGANILRIALEFSLFYLGILPWNLVHYPLSFLLGVMGVFFLVIVTDRLMPQFKDFLFSFTSKKVL